MTTQRSCHRLKSSVSMWIPAVSRNPIQRFISSSILLATGISLNKIGRRYGRSGMLLFFSAPHPVRVKFSSGNAAPGLSLMVRTVHQLHLCRSQEDAACVPCFRNLERRGPLVSGWKCRCGDAIMTNGTAHR